MDFYERVRISMELLSKQRTFTLAEMREQVLRIKIQSSSQNREEEVKYNLRIYYPDWTPEQIEAEVIRLFTLYETPMNKK